MVSLLRQLALLVIIFNSATCGSNSGSQAPKTGCVSDKDCKGDRVCVDGECVTSATRDAGGNPNSDASNPQLLCVPGETKACLCAGGGAGAQTCNSDGQGYSPCDCGQVAADASSGEDALCTSDCQGRQCGDDGCGGSCGSCPSSTSCSTTGKCESSCSDTCDSVGYECDTVCGKNCGTCPAQHACSNGKCICKPSCSGLQCGDDGCGGECGTCPSGQVCNGGACASSCKDTCSSKGWECGQVCGKQCGTCPNGGLCDSGACVCQPDCVGKQCGDDGCGESCGDCSPTNNCVDGTCVSSCVSSPELCDGIDNDCDGLIDELSECVCYQDCIKTNCSGYGSDFSLGVHGCCAPGTNGGFLCVDYIMPSPAGTDVAADDIYIYLLAGDKIHVIGADGIVITDIPAPGDYQQGLTIQSDYYGYYALWVATYIPLSIYALDLSGTVLDEFPGFGETLGSLEAKTPGNTFWIQDGKNVLLVDPVAGKIVSSFASPALSPTGLAWDGASLWLGDSKAGTIIVTSPDGKVKNSFQAPTPKPFDMVWTDYVLWCYSGKAPHRLYRLQYYKS